MECTKCKKILDITNFNYKKEEKKIYYSYCKKCRKNINNDLNKINYELSKRTSLINCRCGKTYIAFRDYHIIRHQNSKFHKEACLL